MNHAIRLFSTALLLLSAYAPPGLLASADSAPPPGTEEKRWILVVYGNIDDGPHNEKVLWPFDSFVGRYLQTPLEYLGYEATYRRIDEKLPDTLPSNIRAVIVDGYLHVPPATENLLVDWLARVRRSGTKILFFSGIPVVGEGSVARFISTFELQGDGEQVIPRSKPRFEYQDPTVIGFEAQPSPLLDGFSNLRAPAKSNVLLRLAGDAEKAIRFEPVFTTSWGGMTHPEYTALLRPDEVNLWIINPFEFLVRSLDHQPFPAPDTTTRMGRRIFYTHIDGDGFSDFSSVQDGQMTSEIIRDRIIRRFPVPVTVSVIESEIRGIMESQPVGISERLIRIARSIFELPNVQAASHAYSHPYVWIENDPEKEPDQPMKVSLKEPYPKTDYNREVEGSIRYIEQNLLPPGKKVEVFLWTGNCRPSAPAVAETRKIGVVNLNGGDTIISLHKNSINCVAPRTMEWGDELQIFASNQNENVYTNDWEGPLFGTFAQVINTFELTESPRRLKPINIYYHFYSADRPDAFRSIELAYQWALSQPIHAITAREYARIAEDSRNTRIYRTADGGWTLLNRGALQTFRIPQSMGYPDMERSAGVIGYKDERDQRYIQTDGAGKATLYLKSTPPEQLYVVSASSPGVCRRTGSGSIEYQFQDYRPVELVLGGLAGQAVEVDLNGTTTAYPPGKDGVVTLQLPETGTVVCRRNK